MTIRCFLPVLVGWFLSTGICGEPAPARAGTPTPDDLWRPHQLEHCHDHPEPRGAVRAYFDEARALFAARNGGDAASLLEMAVAEQGGHPWLLLLLGQIYILAGQGEPHCQPSSGPLAPGGDWPQDRLRLLRRGEEVLTSLGRAWPHDGVVDFLLADAARARDDHETAAERDHRGREKCTYLASLDLLRDLRDLQRRTPRLLVPLAPEYPESAVRRRIQGEVVFDLLIDPHGRVASVQQVGDAEPVLVKAALAAVEDGGYRAGQVGYYPVWSWLRIPVRFTL